MITVPMKAYYHEMLKHVAKKDHRPLASWVRIVCCEMLVSEGLLDDDYNPTPAGLSLLKELGVELVQTDANTQLAAAA